MAAIAIWQNCDVSAWSLQVHAWEPNPQHQAALKAFAGRSRFGSRFTLHPQAAWTADGTVRRYIGSICRRERCSR